MNPRCTPPCSLNLSRGRSLVAALCGELMGHPASECQSAIEESVIAYYPQFDENAGTLDGTDRDEAIHQDIPVGEPALLHEMLHPRSERTAVGQLVDRVRQGQKRISKPIVIFKDAGTYPNESVLKSVK
jgi:hypothetical protein